MNNEPKTEEEAHQDAIGLETKPELMNPADDPKEDENDTLEPDGGHDGDDTEPGTGLASGYAGSQPSAV
jgi:hypothetical protein